MNTVKIATNLAVDAALINEIFESQKANSTQVANTTAKERIGKLDRLLEAVAKTYRSDIKDALHKDFRKHPCEVDLSEVYVVTQEINYARRHLKKWMAKHRVSTPLALMGSSSWIKYEPKGVCLIISPWNFPINLTFSPLVSAIAAGNTAIVKPSEHTPQASKVIKKIVQSIFSVDEVAILEGGVETSSTLLKLPFNHIFFTGAPAIGKIVMQAAAKNLSSVTLELGGKSPIIIDQTADIEKAATRIVWGKFINNGQTCIAPDYVFVHEKKKEQFLNLVVKNIKTFYGEYPKQSTDYSRVVNARHHKRLVSYLEDSLRKGAKLVCGGKCTSTYGNYFDPTILSDVPLDAELMQKEIFGPLLPINTYSDMQEVLDLINAKEKPLALYIYSKNKKNINQILKNTRAGGTCINHNTLHFLNPNLPFGGTNNSGIGKSHGFFGFQAFSNARGIYRQHFPGALELLMPPYNNFKQRIIDLTINWF